MTRELLPGSASPFERRRAGVGKLVLFLTVVTVLFVAGLIVVWRQLHPPRPDGPATIQTRSLPPARQLKAEDVDDVGAHIANAVEKSNDAVVDLKKAKERMDVVIKALDREDLQIEKRRLVAASGLYDAAIKLMNKSGEELGLAGQRLHDSQITQPNEAESQNGTRKE